MVSYGIYYALALTVLGGILAYLTHWYCATPFYFLAAFCLWFFRDPERKIPEGPVAVSPADGKVVSIKADDTGHTRVSIFLNVFDVHVNRAPIAGRISKVEYKRGHFLVASREEASSENEQNTVTVEAAETRVVFKQIAGLIARRIIFYKRQGETVGLGERVGLIKFGSRVDVFFGPEWELAVQSGERVSAGSSVLARRKSE